ncbi:prenylcysteine oxidase 1 [Otolemur garnettii]|uniref:prenylcysteine oxidase 1 n=1 Tax=Otolemur garnettii TaxID=30611 RepID=UPI0006441E7B|nr:prenylcysteine oxidase 1 [Otolemur garnettii]
MRHSVAKLVSSLLGLWLLLCSWGRLGSADLRAPPNKIAIIGAGIGGTSAAYILRQKFGKDVKIDIFEREEVGGRLATMMVQGQEYEAGGSVIHPLNLHMKRFVKDLGLSALQFSGGLVGVYDGETLVFEESNWFIINMIKLIWRYGFQPLRMHMWVEDLLGKFMRIKTHFFHLLTGAVSLSASDSGLWAVEGGNKLVCSGLLQASKSNLISGSVMYIEEKTRTKQKGNPTKMYEVVYQTRSETHSDFYDIVLVATPLNRKMSNITFLNFDPPIQEFHQYYEHIVATLVKGELNSSLFSSRALDNFGLSTILTTDNSDLFINSLGIMSSIRQTESPQPSTDGTYVWKMFSPETLTKAQILKLFLSYDYAVKKPWLAYPHYEPPQKCPSIILHDRLYYTSGIECAASAMEMSAIAGYNAALLAYHRWNENTDMIDQDGLYEKLKTEL